MASEVSTPKEWQQFFSECNLNIELNNVLSKIEKEFFPGQRRLFEAFRRISPQDINVIILGYEPYRNGKATGLAFQVPKDQRITGSLRNIHKELDLEYSNKTQTTRANLDSWSKQGVLLLNAVLTAPLKSPDENHLKQWREFTQSLLFHLSRKFPDKIYMLWGGTAKSFRTSIEPVNNLIMTTGHPGDRNVNRSAGVWFGHNHFVRANQFLQMVNRSSIDWMEGREVGDAIDPGLIYKARPRRKRSRNRSLRTKTV